MKGKSFKILGYLYKLLMILLIKTYVKRLCIKESNVLVPGPGVSLDDDEPGGQAGVIGQQLAWARQPRVQQQNRLEGEW